MSKGKFIVLYGPNNIGKTEQATRLVTSLQQTGIEAMYIKYPIYNLVPTGIEINDILRNGKQASDLELQKLFSKNRKESKEFLRYALENGKWIVAEDYIGTGIAWGVAHGIDLSVMEEINKDLFHEDMSILLDGERYESGIERGHRFEDGDKWQESRDVHKELARRYGWEIVDAKGSIQEVQERIWRVLLQNVLK